MNKLHSDEDLIPYTKMVHYIDILDNFDEINPEYYFVEMDVRVSDEYIEFRHQKYTPLETMSLEECRQSLIDKCVQSILQSIESDMKIHLNKMATVEDKASE